MMMISSEPKLHHKYEAHASHFLWLQNNLFVRQLKYSIQARHPCSTSVTVSEVTSHSGIATHILLFISIMGDINVTAAVNIKVCE